MQLSYCDRAVLGLNVPLKELQQPQEPRSLFWAAPIALVRDKYVKLL